MCVASVVSQLSGANFNQEATSRKTKCPVQTPAASVRDGQAQRVDQEVLWRARGKLVSEIFIP